MQPAVTLTALSAGRSRAGRILGRVVAIAETAAATIMVLEILLLSASVFFRYAAGHPLVWSDELAEILIIWQAMLGAAVAVYRHQHLGLTIVVRAMPARVQTLFQTAGVLLMLIFVAPLAYFSSVHVLNDLALLTPALGISVAWRLSAIPVGLGLMTLIALCEVLAAGRTHTLALVAAVLCAVAVLLAVVSAMGGFETLDNYNLLIFFVGLGGICVAIGLPIAFAFGIASLAYVWCASSAPAEIVVTRMEAGMSHILLLAVPLFILLGAMIDIAGMGRSLVSFLASMIGHVKGGLSYVLIGAMVLVSGISGSKAADMAALVPVLLPEMRRRGAKDSDLVALLAASSAMTETIPPSLVLIMTGAVTGVSIGALFNAGWLPALVIAVLVSIAARFLARNEDVSHLTRASWRDIGQLGVAALPVLILPLLIRGAVVEGIATATEVATVGIAYVLIVTLALQRRFDWVRLGSALKETSVLTGVIFLILSTANAMGWAFVQSGLSSTLADLATDLPGGSTMFMFVAILTFLIIGSILEGIPAIVLLGPLLFPVAKTLGIDEVHFAIVAVLSMGLGLFAPPFGVGYYTACAIGRIEPDAGMKRVWILLAVVFAGIVLVALVPWITSGKLAHR